MKEILPIVIWPGCVLTCFVFACVFFRRQVASFLERTVYFGKDGVKAHPHASPIGTQQGTGDRASAIQEPHSVQATGLRLFLTTPLSGVGNQEQYAAFMEKMRPIMASIRSLRDVSYVYYFNEIVPTLDDFHKDTWSTPEYLQELQSADYMILIVNSSAVSAVYFEAGYALAKEVRAIYLVGPEGKIPDLMKQSAFAYPELARLQTFKTISEVPEILRRILPALKQRPNKGLVRTGDPQTARQSAQP